MSLVPLLSGLLLGGSFVLASPSASVMHLEAHVNDPMSHGSLGDGLLSLDEAIQLANGTLTLGQLSALEAGQITGTGTSVNHVILDPTITGTITVESPLTPITGSGNGMVEIEGLLVPTVAGTQQMVLMLGGNNAHVLALRTHEVVVRGLHFDAGQVAIDVKTAMMGMGGGMGGHGSGGMAMVDECDMHGQTVAGIKLHGSGADESGVMLHHVHFHQMARGVFVDDQTTTGHTMFEAEHVHMEHVDLAAEQMTNGQGGAMSMLMFFRSHIEGGENFIRARRGAGSAQQFMIRVVHCEVQTTEDAIDVEGGPNGISMIHHHVSEIHAGFGFKAMHLWPKTAVFDYHGTEVDFEGDVMVQANLFTQRVYQHNIDYRNGTITFDTDGALPNLHGNRFDNCQIVVPSTAMSQVRLRSSELTNSSVAGQSFMAPVTLEGCYSSGLSMSGQVTDLGPASAKFLGSGGVTPNHVMPGGSFQVNSDVPADIGMVWIFTMSIDRPNTVQEPVRYYGDPQTMVVVPGIFQGQSSLPVTVPSNPTLVGLEAWIQGVTFRLQGTPQPYEPPYNTRVGGLLRVGH